MPFKSKFSPELANSLGWNWEMWWTYDGISGPEFWGVINPAWAMCSQGRRQSPINLDPRTLLHDPNLTSVSFDKNSVRGELVNTGHSLEWRIIPSPQRSSVNLSGGPLSYTYSVSHLKLHFGERDSQGSEHTIANCAFPAEGPAPYDAPDWQDVRGELVNTGHSLEWRIIPSPQRSSVNLSGGPLSYTYSVSHLRLHFGERDSQGSEHTIANYAFPAELQIYGYNSHLYHNFSQAASQVYGVVAVAVLIQVGDRTSPELSTMLEAVPSVKFGGSVSAPYDLRISELIPSTEQYFDYDGSLTMPGCHETVTWIMPNKPLYVSFNQMRNLRRLKQGTSDFSRNAPVANNFRPIQSGHHRTVRTNIVFASDETDERCSKSGAEIPQYKAKEWQHS
ncbi:carbonic anhydrase-related protein 10-like [Macrobrachium nipponense]|uniref:carbonic anhydrase-related protein 10-like n=1 Tax=Macrobrachium nipponense TaxID=159736 RepID=UPI0030C8AD6C